jgi:hypothetical protein
MSARLTAMAFGELLYLDVIGLRGFHAVKHCVSQSKQRKQLPPPTPPPASTVASVVSAMKLACAFYFKKPQCLQRSAVVTRMLRRQGIDAQMVIGCHLPPLQAHAWVEVAGEVVSDYQSGLEYYRVLDRW